MVTEHWTDQWLWDLLNLHMPCILYFDELDGLPNLSSGHAVDDSGNPTTDASSFTAPLGEEPCIIYVDEADSEERTNTRRFQEQLSSQFEVLLNNAAAQQRGKHLSFGIFAIASTLYP